MINSCDKLNKYKNNINIKEVKIMLLKDFIKILQMLDDTMQIKYGNSNSELHEPLIEAAEAHDTGEYYYKIVGR